MNFTNDELYWIERTADIEYSMAMKRFIELCSLDANKITEEEKKQVFQISQELIGTLSFLEELRMKMERNRKGEPKLTIEGEEVTKGLIERLFNEGETQK